MHVPNFSYIARSTDWITTSLIFVLSTIGLLFVYSATYTPDQPYSLFFKKQCIGLLIGIVIYSCASLLSYRAVLRFGYFSYLLLIGLLIFTLLKGSIGMGAQRWINLFFFKIQPSELAKFLFPSCAVYFMQTQREQNAFHLFFPLITLLVVSFILIVKQPDLGTGLIILCAGALMLWLAGLPTKFFAYGFLLLCLSAPVVWKALKPYQKNRIAVFLGYGTTEKERYQIEQATIAIGSGGLWGKGFLKGTQNKLRFLPESRTDFIFAVLCEEWGFVGALFVLLLYSFLYLRILVFITRIQTTLITIFAIGLLSHILLATIINICMVSGLLPIVGIPLPLMSYGLSNLWITLASFGCIQACITQQYDIHEYGYLRQPHFE